MVTCGVETFACDECRTERTHDTCNIGAHDLYAGNALEAAQYGIVIKCTTLYDHVFSKL